MEKWHCSLKSGVWGPAPKKELEKLLKQGYLNKKTWVRKDGEENWIALEQAEIFELAEIPDKPPKPKVDSSVESKEAKEKDAPQSTSSKSKDLISAESAQKSKEAILALGAKGQEAIQAIDLEEKKEKARATFNLYRLFWTRVLKSDFSVIKSTSEECQNLENAKEKVNSPLAQDYSSWRRSMLMICILVLSISTLFNISDIFTLVGRQDIHFIKKIQSVLLLLFQLGSTLLCAFAARNWCYLRKSRSLARFAWLLQFIGPFLVFLIPLSLFEEDQQLLAQLGLGALIILAPKVFGLFPGLIRCSLTVKTLLPETSTPGWLGIIIAPTYSLFLALATIVSIQASEILLGIGFALLAIGMSVVILQAQLLLKPTDQDEASVIVRTIKKKQLLFQIAGIACIGFSIFLDIEEINWGNLNSLFLFIFSFIANVTLLTVVMSDFLLSMIRQGQLQALAFGGTDLEKNLTARLDDLANSGLTDLKAGEAELAASLREKGGFWAKAASSKSSKLMEKAKQIGQKKELGKQNLIEQNKENLPTSTEQDK